MSEVELVDDLPLADLRVGAVGRDDGRFEAVQELAVEVHALAVDGVAADLDGHVLLRVDGLELVADLVGLLLVVVGDLDGGVAHAVAVLDLDDGVREDHLVLLAEQVLVDVRVLERVELPGGVFLQVGRLRVALDGLAGRGDLGVHGLGERVGDAVLDLHVELGGHVLALGVEHFDLVLVDGQVFVVEVVDDAEALHLVGGGVLELVGVERDDVVAGVALEQGLAVDVDAHVGALVLLARHAVVAARDVQHPVGRGDGVVQGQGPLVADLMVAGGLLGHGTLEAHEHARVLALAPVGLHVLVVEHEREGVALVVPLGRVLLLGDGLAGRQVADLEGLLVGGEVLVVHVGHGHVGHVVGEVFGQLRVRGQLVFDLLAGEHDLALHALLLAALAGLVHHVLLHRRHVAADVGFVGRDLVVVDGFAAGVGELLVAARGRAERELVARGLAEVLADLARALAVGVVRLAGHEHGDLSCALEALEGLEV